MMETTIIVIKPGIMTPKDLKAMKAKGLIVIESEDLQAVRIVQAGYDLPQSTLLACALNALKKHACSDQLTKFAHFVADAILEQKP